MSFETERQLSDQEIKNVLDRLSTNDLDENTDSVMDLFDRGLYVISMIGKKHLNKFVDKLLPLLSHKDKYIRQAVVATLGYASRLSVPEFRDEAKRLFDTDPEPDIQSTALRAWTGYYYNTKNAETLKELYRILIDRQYDYFIREEAYSSIFDVAEGGSVVYNVYTDFDALVDSTSDEEFASHINWDEITRIMRQYAPEALK